jgi:tetratricopeptide (TPR) repeat protein
LGFRMRKSLKIAPGVRLNVSPRSIGMSAGTAGARMSVNSSGRVTRTLGIPGTGIFHTSSVAAGAAVSPNVAQDRAANAAAAGPAIRPGVFAPAWEKTLYRALTNPIDGLTLYRLAVENPPVSPTICLIEVLRVSLPTQDSTRARALLNWLHDSQYRPEQDPFVNRYIPRATFTVPVTAGITATMPLARDTLGLILAEFEQQGGNRARATEVVESLEPTTVAAVSLAELYADQARWPDVVELTNGLVNVDEPSTYLLIQRGIALREQGYFEASRTSLKEALRVRSGSMELRQWAYIQRGLTYLAEGKRAMAKKDFERVMAEDSGYPGLAELLRLAGA